ncbi:hypothetical protein C0J52_07953 [Blattella germanica]|nr:hypothetical protein C0J52_07953 [Blattella germanica]
MSFLAAVLATAEENEMEDLKDKTSEISQKITSLKYDVQNFMEESYIKFNILPQETVQLLGRANTLSNDMSQLLDRVETQTKRNLQNSIGELKSLSTSLQETNITLKILKQLVDIDTEIKAAREQQAEGHCFEAAKRIKNVGNLLDESKDIQLEICTSLLSEKSLLQEHFLYDMMEIWKNYIKWEETEPEKELKKVSLKIDTENKQKIEQMVAALNYFEYLDFNMKKFGNNLLKYLLTPIITGESTVEMFDFNNLAVLEVVSKVTSEKPMYTAVFANISKIFEFLHTHLNVQIEDNLSFLNKLGELISEEFCECLIKNCLSETIPSHSRELESYTVISNATQEFQEYLVQVGFLSNNNQSILEYARNVDVLFANKTCQILLGRARDIMKKDLHDTMTVDPVVNKLSIEYIYIFCHFFSSKSTQELLDLVYEVLEEAVQSTDFCAVRLFCTARNIFELYSAVVPTHHKDFLESIPQQVGLATLGEDPTITPSIEKAVRQCLRQLELLHTVWKNVLPYTVYKKSIGCLLNALVEELIIRVTTVEDIPAATAVHLVTVFGIVSDRAPKVFEEPKEVHRFVKRWTKFQELILILGANLRNIDDRWADGKGPLAHEFKPDEVKQLIRALFQNTERRSAVLSRIK